MFVTAARYTQVKPMKLLLVRHLWGVTESWETAFPKFREFGYAAVESRLPASPQRRRFFRLLKEHQLRFIPQVFTDGPDVAGHVRSFQTQVEEALRFDPLFINAHSGRDSWPEDDAGRFFDRAVEIESQAGVKVAHETHRGRVLFTPWTTARMLERCPALQLCCDFSHWVCVAERLLPDLEPALHKAAAHCLHLHARVGYEQGPQVPDPRAPEYQQHLAAHEKWWRWIWTEQRRRGLKVSTLTPEFGPPRYQHTLPFTDAPVSNLWEICNWQAQRQAGNFAAWHKSRA